MFASRATLALLGAAALLVTACGSDDQADTSAGGAEGGDDTPTVVATTSIWADITANVACDGLAQVEVIIPPGGDPHSFEPSLRDREMMDDAALVVANGLFLEESLEDTIDAVEQAGVTVLRVGDGLDTIPSDGEYADDHAEDEQGAGASEGEGDEAHADEQAATGTDGDDHSDDDGEDDHGGIDPHVWWDPTRMAAAVPVIADALAEVGIDRAALDACAAQYVDELTVLDSEVAEVVATLPVDERVLVTNHDSLAYFADRYDFEVLGSVIPSSSSLAATNPAQLDALAADIEATGVAAIFADTQNSSADAEALADRLGDVEVISMLTDTLDEPGTDGATYVGWLRGNVQTIVDALAGAEPG